MTQIPSRGRSAELDAKLAELRETYRRALPEQLEALAALLAAAGDAGGAGAAEEAWRLAHRMKGTSGSYGLGALAAALEAIEASLERAHQARAPATEDERGRALAALARARAEIG